MPVLELVSRGRAWVLGDFVDVDDLCRIHWFTRSREEICRHLLEELRPEFADAVRPGDILVGGRGFGCGGGHDHAHVGLRAAGIGAIVAASFGTQFHRHAIDHALPPLTSSAAAAAIRDGDQLEVDCVTGRIANLTSGDTWYGNPLSGLALEIVRSGGVVDYMRGLIDAA